MLESAGGGAGSVPQFRTEGKAGIESDHENCLRFSLRFLYRLVYQYRIVRRGDPLSFLSRGVSLDLSKVDVPQNALWFSDRGLQVGAVSLASHSASLAIAKRDETSDRLEALLAIAFRRRLAPPLLRHVVKAAEASFRGDHGLANMQLALARLTRVPGAEDLPQRLAMAETLFAAGMAPGELLAALGLHAASDGVVKYDPEQPRVPAGSGQNSGQWTSSGDGAVTTVATAPVPARHDPANGDSQPANHEATASSTDGLTVSVAFVSDAVAGAPLLSSDLAAGLVAGLSAFAASVGFAATFGLLFVPSPNASAWSGSLPGDPNTKFDYNDTEGLLRIIGESGVVVAAGHKDQSGVFHDMDSGVPFARMLEGSLMFDAVAMSAVAGGDEDSKATPRVGARADTEDEPKLCPEPGPDQPGSEAASPRAKRYQEQISMLINPQRPLPYGLALSLPDPVTGKLVHFDECNEKNGTMVDAKGPRYAALLQFSPARENITEEWLTRAGNQVEAAGHRRIEWYFAEEAAAAYATNLFEKNSRLRGRIHIYVVKAK